MIVEYDDETIAEAMEAAAWYERRQDGLVRRFLGKWKEAERRMAADPELNRTFQSDYRRCRFDVFPYALIYRIASEDTIQVIAVMHQSRSPEYWKKREKP